MQTYISVIRDAREVTVITPASHAVALQQALTQEGLSVMDIGLRGRYHSEVHHNVIQKIVEVCKDRIDSRFGRDMQRATNTTNTSEYLSRIVRSILVEQANWHETISSAIETATASASDPWALSVGADALPRSVSKRLSVTKFRSTLSGPEEIRRASASSDTQASPYPDDAIAVIGMSCKFPGADSIDEFWHLLCQGTSMLSKMPDDRFDKTNLPRNTKNLAFWGNFLQDIDAFDHKFFSKSAREAASMDPQQRLLLEVTYQALESAGYFSTIDADPNVGFYIGACSVDYDGNIGSHPPTAYATTGTLRAFLSGRLSHYFGFCGPSLTFDTACSSSAVAIHTACAALRSGDCTQAIAGGATLFTTPYLYENLAAAHFLSPTGATKPFDAAADGYCRGEGVGLVVLKKLADATRDGDNILGVIGGSGINQNANCVSITVPHSPSQGNLYERVARQAGVDPRKVSFVEAHGTGTPVGDPIEMESIRKVFGGSARDSELFVSSVKGNIGHLEGASGVAALIKALLQMKYRTACVQASFNRLNPKIPPLEADRLCIPTENKAITASPIVACINNYGAAGSNAAMLLMEPPASASQTKSTRNAKVPIQISAYSESSLSNYLQALANYCQDELKNSQDGKLYERIAYSLARQQNQDLPNFITASVGSIDEFLTALGTATASKRPKSPPLVLCFGGQVGQQVALDKELFDNSHPLRTYLDQCDDALQSMGFPSIYPAIFQAEAIDDIVVLQSAIFSLQYATASCWLSSGLKVDGVVGHSLGQFAALCISGVLSLRDGLKLVAGRAALMKTHWGAEPGSMIAVEADASILNSLLKELGASSSSLSYEVACYNSRTSTVVVSDVASADALEARLKAQSIKHKRLHVTHGFHSKFTDPLVPHLEALASTVTFNEPSIPLETTTQTSTLAVITPAAIAAHTRDSVYFGEAVQRLQARLGGCTFLECGSHSSVVGMASRALDKQAGVSNGISMELNKPNALDSLAEKTIKLWNLGHKVQYWNHQRSARSQHHILSLPPYQFDKARHWVTYEVPAPKTIIVNETKEVQAVAAPVLIRLSCSEGNVHYFDVGRDSKEFRELTEGSVVAGINACPTSAYLEMAARAIAVVDGPASGASVSVHGLDVYAPLDLSSEDGIKLQLQPVEGAWRFSISSGDCPSTPHASGLVSLGADAAKQTAEFSRYARLATHSSIAALFADPDAVSLTGRVAYNIMAPTTRHASLYHNIQRIASCGDKVVARIQSPKQLPASLDDSILHSHMLHSFLQVASIHANVLQESKSSATFVERQFELVQLGSEYQQIRSNADGVWDILCIASSVDGDLTYDIFAYATSPVRLAAVILGARYSCSLDNTILSAQATPSHQNITVSSSSTKVEAPPSFQQPQLPSSLAQHAATPSKTTHAPPKKPQVDIFGELCTILEKIADVPKKEVRGTSTFDDMGVDSLMMIEVIEEISSHFKLDLPIEDLEQLTDMDSLEAYLKGRLGYSSGDTFGSDTSAEAGLDSSASSTYGATIDTPPEPAEQPSASITKGLTALVAEHLECDVSELKLESCLADLGLDSLLCIELAADIEKHFGVEIDMESLDEHSTFRTLLYMVTGGQDAGEMAPSATVPLQLKPDVTLNQPSGYDAASPVALEGAQAAFDGVRFDFDTHSAETGFRNFWKNVYEDQARLVESYILEAYRSFGIDIAALQAGADIPSIGALPKHGNLVNQLLKILADGGIVSLRANGSYERTSAVVDTTPSTTLYAAMLAKYPQHHAETTLLNVTGSRMAECLAGKADALQLLFANKANRATMAEVYEKAPMCQATTHLLADFLVKAFSSKSGRTFQILEVGAGTGGTARYVIDFLAKAGVDFHYTFTDISSSLVTQAKRTFSTHSARMTFTTLDCDQPPKPDLVGQFDAVIATNCIHATQNVTTSCSNMAQLLRKGGALCLVEFTRGLYWFDLVYGLLEGWWAFSDGRKHALADEWFWQESLKRAGFQHVSWTDGNSRESHTMRVICGFREAAEKEAFKPLAKGIIKRAGIPVETFTWKRVGDLELKADVFYPKTADEPGRVRKMALMIHGGGHLLFSRQDIPMKHVRVLLQRGYLPVSVDYRLCPEVSLFEGPVTDCCDALEWVRNTLPKLTLTGPAVRLVPDKVLALGWSSGGQLAMTLGYTAPGRGIKAPDVILPFYSPSDLEAECKSSTTLTNKRTSLCTAANFHSLGQAHLSCRSRGRPRRDLGRAGLRAIIAGMRQQRPRL